MATKKKGIPDFQHTPAAPEPVNLKPYEPEQIFSEVISVIRQLKPGQQNWVVKELLKELVFDRENSYLSASAQKDDAGKNLEEFLQIGHTAEYALKERAQQKDNAQFNIRPL
jgi:retron-type reverse transcriptase